MGLHLSIDDFGTGYSSLSALQQFPIGTLKIDQSFVRDASEDAGDATIVRTIIDMGRSLGMEVVAEGVESQRQLEFLRGNRCHFGQGRLFGEPCTVEDLLALLARQARGPAPFAHLLRASTRQPPARPDARLLTLTNVRLRRGPQVLSMRRRVSIFRGEKVGVVGRNGCGKSTLLALIKGELTTDAGEYSAPPNLAIASVAQELPDSVDARWSNTFSMATSSCARGGAAGASPGAG